MVNKKTGNIVDFDLLKRVLLFTKLYRSKFVLAGLSAIFLSFLGPIRPIIINYSIDNYILIPDAVKLLEVTILLLVILLFEGVFQFYYIFLSSSIGQYVIQDLRAKTFKHILSLRLTYFDKTPIGKLVTRTISDIETISTIFSDGLLLIIADLLKLVMVIAMMFYTDWGLTLISLMTLPLLLIATSWFKRNIKSAFQQVRDQVSLINTFVQEHIVGMNIVQIFNRQNAEYRKFKNINKNHLDAHLRSIFYYSVFFPIVEILSAFSIGLIIWYGGVNILKGNNVSIGELVAFILFIHMMFRPIRQLADRFNILQMGIVGAERVFRVLDKNDRVQDSGRYSTSDIEGSISFKEVKFAYKKRDWVLKDISFNINTGKILALVGDTGAGKTSIINLLNRFYDIQHGEIQIDNISISDFKLKELRESISIVQQDVFLFSDSIMNNILLYDKKITQETVVEASKKLGVHDFIMSLPGGYDYVVGERGVTISVGQRQLISFLRVYVRKSKILVLDEATSTIDSVTESLLQSALNKVKIGRTIIIIAHRLSTIIHADKILYLESGKILEEGTHEELIKNSGYYSRMYYKQNESD